MKCSENPEQHRNPATWHRAVQEDTQTKVLRPARKSQSSARQREEERAGGQPGGRERERGNGGQAEENVLLLHVVPSEKLSRTRLSKPSKPDRPGSAVPIHVSNFLASLRKKARVLLFSMMAHGLRDLTAATDLGTSWSP